MKRAADRTAVRTRRRFLNLFAAKFDFRLRGAIRRPTKAAYSGDRLIRPARILPQEPAIPYFNRMIFGGREFTKSDGMLLPRPRFRVGRARRRRLRGGNYFRSRDGKTLFYTTAKVKSKKRKFRIDARPRAPKPSDKKKYRRRGKVVYVGPFKNTVRNPSARRVYVSTLRYADRVLANEVRKAVRRELRIIARR